MKRTTDDTGARPRLFIPRPAYQVRWPTEAPFAHDEDKPLLRDLVQFVEERVATRTTPSDGVESGKASTAFDYVIQHSITDTADFYTLRFHLPYNVVESAEDVLTLHAMCNYSFGSMDRIFNFPAARHELLLKVWSKRRASPIPYTPIVFSPLYSPLQGVGPSPDEEEQSESLWGAAFSAITRPFKRARNA